MGLSALLNLLNELRNDNTMRGFPSMTSLFCNEFTKFNNTDVRMLTSGILHHI